VLREEERMTRLSPEHILGRFKHHLNEVVIAEKMHSMLGLADGRFDPNVAVDLLVSNSIDPAAFVPSVTWQGILEQLEAHPGAGHAGGRRLVIAPSSPLFTPILEQLAGAFTHIVFIDINRGGLRIGDKTIEPPDAVEAREDDLCLILTRNEEACGYYERKFGKENCLNWLRAFVRRQKRELSEDTEPFLDQINGSRKPILFVSSRPMATLNSTIRKMHEDGFSTFWLGSEHVKDAHQTGYATPRVEDVALTDYSIGSLIDILFTFTNLERGMALYHFETIYPPAWDFNRVAICYAGTLAMIRTVKECRPPDSTASLGLYMYDAIKPGVKNFHAGETCGRLYRQLMLEAEAIIFSSYTEAFGDFVENAVGKRLPRVHHHRYQTVPSKRRPRLTDGYHVAIISVLLEDFWEPSRMGLVPYVRDLIAQGIHIHYYVADHAQGKVFQFLDSLPESQKHLFHLHTPIHDLEELANELSQYHVGWSLFNMQVFSDIISNLTDQFTRDAMDLFTPTTLPSVIWTCTAAGLPVICNRSMQAVVDLLPPGMALPLTLSELHNLSHILDEVDWDAIDRIPLESLDISNHIHKLYRFLDGYYAE
jgi:hypothetical protein